jgi:hypothetical protein
MLKFNDSSAAKGPPRNLWDQGTQNGAPPDFACPHRHPMHRHRVVNQKNNTLR